MTKKQHRKKISKVNATPKIHEGLAIICLLLNIFLIPGLGSVIGAKTRAGIAQMILFFAGIIGGIILVLNGAPLVGVLLFFLGMGSAWIWGIVSGVRIVQSANT